MFARGAQLGIGDIELAAGASGIQHDAGEQDHHHRDCRAHRYREIAQEGTAGQVGVPDEKADRLAAAKFRKWNRKITVVNSRPIFEPQCGDLVAVGHLGDQPKLQPTRKH